MEVGQSWPIQGIWQITRTSNTGGTLDLFCGHTILLIVSSVVGIELLIALYWPRPKTGIRPQLAIGLLMGGAFGNLLDRLIFGHVTDFMDIMPWIIFNVADVSIVAGLLGFVQDIPDVLRRLLSEPDPQYDAPVEE